MVAGDIDHTNLATNEILNTEQTGGKFIDLESNGLFVTNLKRRRVEEPNSEEQYNEENKKDTEMIDNQTIFFLKSKNMEMAGAVRQPRQLL